MKNLLKIFLFVSILSLLLGCEKNAGEGGNATVVGNVWVKEYNSTFTELIGEYAAMQEDVFIVYGDNIGFDDKTETDYMGNYRFNYLRPGKYTIFAYSKDSSMQSVSGEVVVIKQIEISKSNETLTVPQIIIFD
ncbi:MAG: hypothetical protein JXR36_16905 [Bacteroidales bacterium]|nr:hypothetical protein [Bacteroidales bacterium]